MNVDKTGGPAYPGLRDTDGYGCARVVDGPHGRVFENWEPGMTVRQAAAMAALPAIINGIGVVGVSTAQTTVELAFQHADEFIRQSAPPITPHLPNGITFAEVVESLKEVRDDLNKLLREKDGTHRCYPDLDKVLEHIEKYGLPKP